MNSLELTLELLLKLDFFCFERRIRPSLPVLMVISEGRELLISLMIGQIYMVILVAFLLIPLIFEFSLGFFGPS